MSPNGEQEPAAADAASPPINVFIDAMVTNATAFLEAYRKIVTEAFTKAQADTYTADDFVSDAAKLWASAFQAIPKPPSGGPQGPS